MKYRFFVIGLICFCLSFLKSKEGNQNKSKKTKAKAIPVITTAPMSPIKKAELDSVVILAEARDATKIANDAFDTASSVTVKSKSDMDHLKNVIYNNVALVRKNMGILSLYQKKFNNSYAYINKGNIKSKILNENYKDINKLQYSISHVSSESRYLK